MCDRIHRGQHIRRHAEFGWRDYEAVGEEIEAIHGEEKRDAFRAGPRERTESRVTIEVLYRDLKGVSILRKVLCAAAAASILFGQAARPPASPLDEAISLQKKGAAREAQKVLRGLVPRLRQLRDEANLARALVASSEAVLSLGEYDAAIQSSMEAAGIHRKARHDEFEAEDWNTIGRANVYLGRYQAALEGYERALALDRKRLDTQGEIIRLYNIGNVYFEQDRPRTVRRSNNWCGRLRRAKATPGEKPPRTTPPRVPTAVTNWR